MAPMISGSEIYGPGSWVDEKPCPVPDDSRRVFEMLAKATPGFTQNPALLNSVSFEGSAHPISPGPLKAPVIAAALHAMCGVVANEILEHRDGHASDRAVMINTDHAALWLGSVGITERKGQTIPEIAKAGKMGEIFEKNLEKGTFGTPLRLRATAVYPTKDPSIWYQLHGSLNADPVLRTIGLDPDMQCDGPDDAYRIISEQMVKFDAQELDRVNVETGLCGSVCYTPEGWRQTQMSKELSKYPLVNYKVQSQAVSTPAVPLSPRLADKRPLAGIKVVELVRIIAGPVIGSILSALGADVIRANCSRLPDFNSLQLTMNAGIRTVDIDLKQEKDVAKLRELIQDADIFIQGYRPGVIAKGGLSLENLLELAGVRGKGIVYVEENCYGPDGPMHERPGWQQIADAASGCSFVTGKSLGFDDGTCILPALPVPDMLTGLIGAIGAMMAIRDRAQRGGSYHVFASLMAAASFPLDPEVGLYPPDVVEECSRRFDWGETTPALFVLELPDVVLKGWKKVFSDRFTADSSWMTVLEGHWGKFQLLKPVIQLADGKTSPRWLTAPEANCCQNSEAIAWL